jgi:hypothetical protein
MRRRTGRASQHQDAAYSRRPCASLPSCPRRLHVGDRIEFYGFCDADADAEEEEEVELVCEAQVLAVLPGDLRCTLLWTAPYTLQEDFSFIRKEYGVPGGWLVMEAVADDGEGAPSAANVRSPPLLIATPRPAEQPSQPSKRRRLDPSPSPAWPDFGWDSELSDGPGSPHGAPAVPLLPSDSEAEGAPSLAWEGGGTALQLGQDCELQGEGLVAGGEEDPAWWRTTLVGVGNGTLTVRLKTVAACDSNGEPLRDEDGVPVALEEEVEMGRVRPCAQYPACISSSFYTEGDIVEVLAASDDG